MDYIKIEGYNNYVKDPNTNSVINMNMNEYNQYLARKSMKDEENERIQSLESDVTNIKENLNEIKSLLRRLIDESR